MLAKNLPYAVLFMTVMSACGDSNDPGVDAEEIQSLATRAFSAPEADPLDLPAQATMSGFVAIEIDSDIIAGPMIGDMAMTADFDADVLSGTASNVGEYEPTGDCDLTSNCVYDLVQTLDGELVLTEGTINDIYFEAMLDGQLVRNDVTDGYTVDISMVVDGGFRMDSEGLLAIAEMEGLAFIEPQVGDPIEVTADGAFIVAE